MLQSWRSRFTSSGVAQTTRCWRVRGLPQSTAAESSGDTANKIGASRKEHRRGMVTSFVSGVPPSRAIAASQQKLVALPEIKTQDWLFICSSSIQRQTHGKRRTHEGIDTTDDKAQTSETECFL